MKFNKNILVRYSSFLLFSLIPLLSFAQTDSINYESIFKVINNCEALTDNIQKQVPKFVQNDPTKASIII